MDKTFTIYTVFGSWISETSDGRSYGKLPLSVWLDEDAALVDAEELAEYINWIPKGGKFLSIGVGSREVSLYPDDK